MHTTRRQPIDAFLPVADEHLAFAVRALTGSRGESVDSYLAATPPAEVVAALRASDDQSVKGHMRILAALSDKVLAARLVGACRSAQDG